MDENEISKIIINCAIEIHKKLSIGLLESVYEIVLAYELESVGLKVDRQKPIPLIYKELKFLEAFRADLIVNESVIIEIKSVEKIAKVHCKQLLTYLRLMNKKLGILLNFGEEIMKDGIHRAVNGLKL